MIRQPYFGWHRAGARGAGSCWSLLGRAGCCPAAYCLNIGLLCIAINMAACSEVLTDAPLPLLSGDGFFDSPWPDDSRTFDGYPDMGGFPHREDVELLDTYLALAESQKGFGNNSPVFIRFDGALDTSLLPDSQESTRISSTLLLVDVDNGSPQRGGLIPVQWDFQEEETEYQPAHLLAVAPVAGFPLRPSTTYALVLREPLARSDGSMEEHWQEDDPDYSRYLPLKETLEYLAVDLSTVVAAAIFTTQDPVGELAEYASYIRNDLAIPTPDQSLSLLQSFSSYDLYEGWFYVPLFQEGERPYNDQGGGFYRNYNGGPAVYEWEYIRFALSVPTGSQQPQGGWPVFLYSHGTGGDYVTFADEGYGLEPANLMAIQGVAGLGIDQPLHGVRATEDTDPEYHTFNYFNPDSARSTIRQGSLDEIFLATMFSRQQASFDTEEHGEVLLDPDRIAFFGHSQGGLVGAMAAPFVGDIFRGVALSGAGGGIATTIIQRKEPFDIAALLETTLGCSDDEVLDELHPVVGLMQWLTDVTDPINYSPWWFRKEPPWQTAAAYLLLSEGLLDEYTPSATTEAMAAAGHVPVVEPVVNECEASVLMSLGSLDLPTSGESTGFDGQPVTAGLMQVADQGHYAVFYDSSVAMSFTLFLTSSLQEDPPSIVDY